MKQHTALNCLPATQTKLTTATATGFSYVKKQMIHMKKNLLKAIAFTMVLACTMLLGQKVNAQIITENFEGTYWTSATIGTSSASSYSINGVAISFSTTASTSTTGVATSSKTSYASFSVAVPANPNNGSNIAYTTYLPVTSASIGAGANSATANAFASAATTGGSTAITQSMSQTYSYTNKYSVMSGATNGVGTITNAGTASTNSWLYSRVGVITSSVVLNGNGNNFIHGGNNALLLDGNNNGFIITPMVTGLVSVSFYVKTTSDAAAFEILVNNNNNVTNTASTATQTKTLTSSINATGGTTASWFGSYYATTNATNATIPAANQITSGVWQKVSFNSLIPTSANSSMYIKIHNFTGLKGDDVYIDDITIQQQPTTYYYGPSSSTDITSPNAWWSSADGTGLGNSGVHPSAVTMTGLSLYIENTGTAPTMSTSLALGSGTTLYVGGGSGAATYTLSGSNYLTGGAVTVNTNGTLAVSHAYAGATPTVLGSLQLNSGGTVSTAPAYSGTSSTVVYNEGGSFSTGTEWNSTSGTVGAGVPQNVTIQNTSTVTLGGNRTVTGALTLTSGAMAVAGNTLSLNGSVATTTGTLTTTTSSALSFGAAITLPNNVFTSSPASLASITFNTTGFTFGNQAVVVSGAWTQASSVQVNLGTGLSHLATSLSLGGSTQSNGSWGSTASAATNTNSTYFGSSATGTVNIYSCGSSSDNTTNYSSGSFSNGSTDGTGFSTWTISGSGAGTGGSFSGTCNINGAGSQAWGIYAYNTYTESAVRPFSTALGIGNTLSFQMQLGSFVTSGSSEGFSLFNASGNAIMELYYVGGGTDAFTVHDNGGTNALGPTYTQGAAGINVYISYTTSTTYNILITSLSGTQLYSSNGRTLMNPSGGQVPAKARFYSYNTSGSGQNLYFNYLSLNNPVIFASSIGTQTVCQNAAATALSVTAFGGGNTYQWYSNASNANTGGTLIPGATGSSYTPPSNTVGTTYYYCIVSSCSGTWTSAASGAIIIASLPNVSGFATSATTPCQGSASTVTISATSLTAGTYTVTYNLSGTNTATGSTATATIASNTGTFNTSALANSGSTTITVTAIQLNSTTCTSTVSSGNTASVTVTASSVGGTASSAQTICFNTSPANITLSGNTGSTIQWQYSTDNSTWTNIGTSSTTLTSAQMGSLTTGTYYRASVSNSGCTAANSSAVLVSTSVSSTGSSVYGGSWLNGSNDYTTGFNAWNLTAGTVSGFFIGSSSTVDVAGNAFGLYSNSSGQVASAVRPFTSNMGVGNTLSFDISHLTVQSGGTVGFSLLNATGGSANPLMEFYFVGGQTAYTVNDNAGNTNGNTAIPWTNGAIHVGLVYTSATGNGTYSLYITAGGVNYIIPGTFKTATGGQVPAQIRIFNANAGNLNNVYVNKLVLNNPVITTQPSTSAQSVCLGSSTTNLTVAASGSGTLSYQWFSNTSASTSGATNLGITGGAQTATLTPQNSTAGTLYYYCVITGACSTTTTSNFSGAITINALPTANAGSGNTVCMSASPSAITLNGSSIGGSATTGTWSITSLSPTNSGVNGSLSSTSPQTGSSAVAAITYTPPANYSGTIILTLTTDYPAGCSAATNTRTITVNAGPTAVSASATTSGVVCSGTSLSLNGSATGATSWGWTGPNSFSSSSQSPSVSSSATGAMAGTYTLTATGSNTCTTSATVSVTVNTTPTSVSASNNGPVCAGTSLSLTGSATGATSWSWSGPNSYSNATQSPTVNSSATTAMAGSYTLTATGTGGCTANANTSVTVNTAPSVTSSPTDPTAVTSGAGTATFTVAATGSGLTYQWQEDAGSGFVDVTNGGIYGGATTVTLTLTNATGSNNGFKYHCVVTGTCTPTATSGYATLTVTSDAITTGSVTGSPFCSGTTGISVPFTYTPPANFVIGGTCTFTAQLSDATGSFASPVTLGTVLSDATGSQSITTTTGLPATAGTGYRIRVVSNLPSVSGTDNGSNLIIHASPSAATLSGTATICFGSNTNLSVAITGGTSPFTVVYTGDGGGTWSSYTTGTNKSVSPGSSTTYGLTSVTDANGCTVASPSGSATVTVNTSSADPTSASATATTICNGSSTSLTLTGGGGGTGETIYWHIGSAGGTSAGTGNSLSVSPSSTTTYYGRYEDGSPCSHNSAAQTVTITVNQKSADPTSASAGATAICNGSSTTLTLSGGGSGTGETITWYSGSAGGTLEGTGNGLSVSPTTATTYYGRYEDGSPCSYYTASQSVAISINARPSAATLSGTATICNSSSTNLSVAITGGASPYSVVYTGNGGGTWSGYTTGTNQSVSPTSTTTYGLTSVTDANGCTVASPSGTAVVTVNANPTLSGVSAGSAVNGTASTVSFTTIASATFTVSYTINGVAQTAITGVTSNGSGAASFSSRVLTNTDNGLSLAITGLTRTDVTPNCAATFSTSNSATLTVTAATYYSDPSLSFNWSQPHWSISGTAGTYTSTMNSTGTDNVVIQSGSTVTMDANYTTTTGTITVSGTLNVGSNYTLTAGAAVTVAGTLNVNATSLSSNATSGGANNGTFIINAGTTTISGSLTVNGYFKVLGTLAQSGNPTLTFNDYSVYEFNNLTASSGIVPAPTGSGTVTWTTNSNILISGMQGSSSVFAFTQNNATYGNVTFTATSAIYIFGASNLTVTFNNFTYNSSSTNKVKYTAGGYTYNITVNGDFAMSSTTAQQQWTNLAGNTVINLNVYGNFSWATAGAWASNGLASINSAINLYGTGKTFNAPGIGLQSFLVDFKSGSSYTLGANLTSTLTASPYYSVTVDGTLDCAGYTITGQSSAGAFTLSAGATLKTTLATGVNGVVLTFPTKTFTAGANYEFYGSGSSAVIGALVTNSINNLTINNSNGVSLSANTTVAGALNMTSGKLAIGAFTLNINGTQNTSTSNCLTGGASSLLSIGGSGTIGTVYFDQGTPGTTNKLSSLTLNNTNGTTLGNAVSTTTLALTAGTLTNSTYLTINTAAVITRTAGALTASPTWGGTVTSVTYNPSSTMNTSYELYSTVGTLSTATGSSTVYLTSTTAVTTLTVSGSSLYVNSGVQITNSGASTVASGKTLTIDGTVTASAALAVSGTMIVNNGGLYEHNQGSGTIPTATWNTGSTCSVTGWTTSSSNPGGLGQSFYNFTWNSPNQTSAASVQLSGALTTATGTLTVNTYLGQLRLATNNSGGYTGNFGAIVVNGGSLNLNTGGSAGFGTSTNVNTINVAGDVTLNNAAVLVFCSANTSYATNLNVSGNFTMNGTSSITRSTTDVATLSFVKGGSTVQQFTQSATATIANPINITVGSATVTASLQLQSNLVYNASTAGTLSTTNNSTIDFQGNYVTGSTAIFNLTSGSTLITANAAGISSTAATGSVQVGGSKTYSTTANYVYNGSASSAHTGNALPATVNNLTINNSNGVTNDVSTAVNGALTLTNGKLVIGAHTLTLNGTVASMSGTNSLTGSTSSIVSVTGTGSVGTIYFDQTTDGTTNMLSSLTVNRTSSGAVTVSNKVVVSGLTTITAGVVTLSDNGNTTNTLTLGTAGANLGKWGSTSSSATYKNDTYFGSTGYITVSTSTAATPVLSISSTNPVTYNGSAQTVTVSGTSGAAVSNIQYAGSATAPSNAGTYAITADIAATAFYNAGTGLSAGSFVINKASSSITATGTTSYTYTGLPQGPASNTESGSTGAITYSYSGTGSTSYGASSTKPTLIGTYQVIATVAADANYNTASSSPLSFSIVAGTPGTWLGTYSINYSDYQNWSDGVVPASGVNITIPGGTTYSPELGGNVTLGNVSGSITIYLNGNTLTINGSISSGTTFSSTPTSSLVLGSAAAGSTITFAGTTDSVTNGIANLTVNGNVTLGSTIHVYGLVTVGTNVTFDVNHQHLVLHSDAAYGTAAVGPVNDGSHGTISNADNVTVQRYHANKRAWILMSAPLTMSGITRTSNFNGSIFNNWQKQTYITAPPSYANPSTNGMDAAVNNTYGMLRWIGTGWGRVLNTMNDTSLIGNQGGSTADNKPFFLFVRGDRTISPTAGSTSSSAVTFRANGALQTGDKTFSFSNTSTYALVANPYPAPIDLASFIGDNTGLNTGANVYFYYWDPNNSTTGGYTTAIYNSGSWSYSARNNSNTSALAHYIQSGQAFFVTSNGQSSATFKETQKSTGSSTNAVFGNSSTATINVDISKGSSYIDGVLTMYNNNYSAAVIAPTEDGYKFWGNEEGVAITRTATNLSVEARPVIAGADTTFLYMNKMVAGNTYTFNISANNIATNITGVLVDKYLNKSTALDLTASTSVNFTVDTAAAAKSAARFMIVFNAKVPLYVSDIRIKASVKAKAALVDWSVATEKDVKNYTVEHSTNAKDFVTINTTAAKNISNSNYSYTDNSAVTGDNYYRIKAINLDGTIQYSSIAKVTIGDRREGISIYPNPIVGKTMNVQLSNIAAGTYMLSMINANGQQVMEQSLQHAGGSVTSTVQLPSTIASGVYQLRLASNGKSYTETVIVK